MSTWTLTRRNLGRNRLRTILTTLAIAFSIFLVCAVMTLPSVRNTILARSSNGLRLVVHHKYGVSFGNLPLSYVQQIRALPYVTSVTHLTWFGGIYSEPKDFFQTMQSTRRRGVLRAMGFSRSAVLLSFVTESLWLSLLGYMGGVALGTGTILLVNQLMQGMAFQLPSFSTVVVRLRVSPTSLVIALVLTLIMGIIGGLFPAHTAAKLRVTEALRRG
ncbi:MAG TPA: FtsX-like permease family protein [Methylomirabilota bacterium]|jgi:ABC-type antimicrobial peptide transport system permease subunit|nr:FtsX-like permease family protein [Methylomirabilota bacterium]